MKILAAYYFYEENLEEMRRMRENILIIWVLDKQSIKNSFL